MTVSEYQVAQLYCVAESSKQNTDGQEGVEVVKNEPFENFPLLEGFSSGQYTYKIYHFASKVPAFVRYVLPSKSMSVHEEAWNAFPYCRTVLTNPTIGKKTFKITIETMHLGDKGDTDNAHQLPPELLSRRKVSYIDIANDQIDPKEYNEAEDPTLYHSEKTGRGPLTATWRETSKPVMTCYKLVTAEFAWFGLQTRIENWIQTAEQRLFLQFHRKLFCTTDQWYGMTMDDIRKMEDELKEELQQILTNRRDSLVEPTEPTK